MAHQELRTEMRGLDPDAYRAAVANIAWRLFTPMAPDTMMTSFGEEFPNFAPGLIEARQAVADSGLPERDQEIFALGFGTSLAAIKAAMDTAKMNEEFSNEGNESPTE